MARSSFLWVGRFFLLFCLVFGGVLGSRGEAAAAETRLSPADSLPAALQPAAGTPDLLFVKNDGQADARAAYFALGKALFFTRDGVRLALRYAGEGGANRAWGLGIDFWGASRQAPPQAAQPAPTVIAYYGAAGGGQSLTAQAYQALHYTQVWDGVDAAASGEGGQLKLSFQVEAGADIGSILLAYGGLSKAALERDGTLLLAAGGARLAAGRPSAYQRIGGQRVDVPASFRLRPGKARLGAAARRGAPRPGAPVVVGFDLQGYRPERPLVIEFTLRRPEQPPLRPAALAQAAYAGYIGGDYPDYGMCAAVDRYGAAYVAGITYSKASFPTRVGPFLVNPSDYEAGFISKVAPDGKSLVYSGFFTGYVGRNRIYGIAVDESGAAYIAGYTQSAEDEGFPLLGGPRLTFGGGSADAFVAKIKPDGSGIDYSGYIGGSGWEEAYAIAVDSSGAAYVVGQTESDQDSFPVKIGPTTTYNGGRWDGFIAKVKPDGSDFVYAGYIGGSGGYESANAVAVDAQGAAFVSGDTESSASTFPVKTGPSLVYRGEGDAYLAKVKPDGSGFVFAGYIGGAKYDVGNGVAVDSSGAAYLTGHTFSPETSFPVKTGPDLTFNDQCTPSETCGDAFVAKVKADGSGLEYAGYIGGAKKDAGKGIALDDLKNVYIVGDTASSEASFPVKVGPAVGYPAGGGSAFIARLKASGSGLDYCGYIGGFDHSAADSGSGVAVDASRAAYIAGTTYSTADKFPVKAGPALTYSGMGDAFILKLGGDGPPLPYMYSSLYLPFLQRR